MQSQEINLMVLYEQHQDLIWELQLKREYRAITRQQSPPLIHILLNSIGAYMINWGSKLQHYGASRHTIATAKH